MQDRIYQKKVKDVNELREQLVEVWAGLQQNVIDDACVPTFGLEEDILSICCDCISYLGYGS